MTINPIVLTGNWNEGFVLDKHIKKSTFEGYDHNGEKLFDNVRSELGELLYHFKYRGKKENAKKIGQYISPFLDDWNIKDKIDVIIPTPSSNKERRYQPVDVICEEIGTILDRGVTYDFLSKVNGNQSKNMDDEQKKSLKGSIVRKLRYNRPANVLLVDDLYDTGGTLKECVRLLKEENANIKNIYVLALTKTGR